MKDKFREISKMISKITLKVIKMKILGEAHQIFFQISTKMTFFPKKQMSKKALFVV